MRERVSTFSGVCSGGCACLRQPYLPAGSVSNHDDFQLLVLAVFLRVRHAAELNSNCNRLPIRGGLEGSRGSLRAALGGDHKWIKAEFSGQADAILTPPTLAAAFSLGAVHSRTAAVTRFIAQAGAVLSDKETNRRLKA